MIDLFTESAFEFRRCGEVRVEQSRGAAALRGRLAERAAARALVSNRAAKMLFALHDQAGWMFTINFDVLFLKPT